VQQKAKEKGFLADCGTKLIVDKYGDKLICVRYIYDPVNQTRIKTVELIEEKRPYISHKRHIPPNKMMHLRVAYGEVSIGKLIKNSGGYWNKEEGYWELPYREVIALGLDNRVINC